MQMMIASGGWFTQTTNWTARLKSTATTAGKQTTGDTSSMRQGYGAGNTAIDGGTSMNVAGTISGTGMITTMTTTGTNH